MPSIVVLDANVLFSARLRDLWLQLSQAGVVRVFWTDAIEAEWTAAVGRARPELSGLVARTVSLMRSAFPLSYIANDQLADVAFGLPDPLDEHVARAAAAVSGVIVTFNVSDFPESALEPHGLVAMSPDEALLDLARNDEIGVLESVRAIRLRLKNPPIAADAYAAGLAAISCRQFAGGSHPE
ncbi:MAG: PIN domain-containing protein [Rhodospirillales bacterium]|nr:PIN domain-containing protein [Rhodospirillales bacterium]